MGWWPHRLWAGKKRDNPGAAPGVLHQLLDLRAHVEALLRAEWDYWRALAALALAQARTILFYAVLAGVLVVLALFALITGLLLALGAWLGPWAALLLVFGGLALAVWWCVHRAIVKARRLWRALFAADGGRS